MTGPLTGSITGGLPPEQLATVLRALLLLGLGSIAARPLALRLVPGGGGWIAALLLAWSVMGWVPWALSALGLVPFDAAALSGLALLLAARLRLGAPPPDPRGGFVAAAGFAGLFWLGLAQRLGRADLTGLEKFTDTGFLAAAMRTSWMPPQDAWFAGEGINYYYVGQAMAGAWGLMTGAAVDHTYQIAMAMLFALSGLAVYRLVTWLAAPWGGRIAAVLGALAALLSLYGGNLHSVLYTLLRRWMPAGSEAFYYPDSTRFIGFDPPVGDKGFTEFLSYAFAVGDLHAHVIATPVFLLGLLVALAMLRRGQSGTPPSWGQAAGLGWCLGLCAAINTWDVAVLGLFALLAALALIALPQPRPLQRLDGLGASAVIAAFVAFVTAAPFLGQFTPFSSGVEAAPAQSPAWQLLVIYGHGLPALALFAALAAILPAHRALLPVGLLFVAVILLVALPETVIMRDIYGEDFARANTMFKLSFRAQTLLIVAALAVLAPAVRRGGVWFGAALLAAAPLVALLAYAPHIAVAPSAIRSLDGLGFLGNERALVGQARRLPFAEGEALIEATGPAFGETARVSAMTGQPAVIGWAAHEWLWRGGPDAPHARAAEVDAFYTSADRAARCATIRRYGVRYVILGEVEARRYPGLEREGIRALGPLVYRGAGGEIVQIAPGACEQ